MLDTDVNFELEFQSRVRVFVLSDPRGSAHHSRERRFNLAFEFSFCLTGWMNYDGKIDCSFNLAFEFSFCLTECRTLLFRTGLSFQSRVRVFVLSDSTVGDL